MAEFVAVALLSSDSSCSSCSTFCWYNISRREKGFFLCMRSKLSDSMFRNERLITRSLDDGWTGFNEWQALAKNGSYLDHWEELDNTTEIRLVCFKI